MNFILDILIFAVVLSVLWIIALEVRFRTLKNAAANSEELAQEAIDEAEALLAKVRAELAKEAPKAKLRKR